MLSKPGVTDLIVSPLSPTNLLQYIVILAILSNYCLAIKFKSPKNPKEAVHVASVMVSGHKRRLMPLEIKDWDFSLSASDMYKYRVKH